MDAFSVAVAIVELVLGIAAVGLTIFYGRLTCDLLREISRGLSRDRPHLLD
jgi:hypothetical protein